ncbi:TDP-N-acetylfucosamine:lipid II N-acetylfucosaminyltransferase [Cellulophaga sp. 20_2_10]|uniref:TDP-N-acetylfucosamine:lipid II N-acetylfucosaminyltransferase n=1 Tax=Cellulophaga sp. 20_2_10 TaxID=2942476 RepID=UPI00201AAC3E|nr:TDP-N-acetylfucosamine:lipid II N-acetylfucosaminyltransferase [Cellulophaga sp. 20_2_10]MCL5247326.1 TDP-N-acetylfucosamine:lipid II N-acetylfucosaminyltransferase [Cellulophaga sp. 20_2_10]
MHIATDEKFINSISWQFGNITNTENYYVILLDSIDSNIKYVTLDEKFKIVVKNKNGLDFCIKEIEKHDIVIFHGLNYFQSQIVLKTNNVSKLVWFFWGGEFYDNPKLLKLNSIGDKTKELFVNTTIKNKLKRIIRPLFYFLKNHTKTPERTVLDAAKKIHHFGILYKEEMDYFKSLGCLSDDVSFFKMTYYPLDFIFKGIENIKVSGTNILIGNSASLTNNHIEAFDLLKDIKLENRKIIVPLSYGDKNYGKSISHIGKTLFGQNMMPLSEFITLNEFNTLLSSCNVVIMNHYRQQAVGNVIAVLWMGSKVYLNESNTLYHYLKRIGIAVFSINEELKKNPEAFVGLNDAQINNNRKILISEMGFEAVKSNMFEGLKSILNDY